MFRSDRNCNGCYTKWVTPANAVLRNIFIQFLFAFLLHGHFVNNFQYFYKSEYIANCNTHPEMRQVAFQPLK